MTGPHLPARGGGRLYLNMEGKECRVRDTRDRGTRIENGAVCAAVEMCYVEWEEEICCAGIVVLCCDVT